MSNHSQNPEFMESMAKSLGLGATGKYPEGKLHDTDEGELVMAITSVDKKVVISFGKPTAWIGFTKEQAYELADTLRDKANSI